jgi:hypothetical protein
MEEDMVNTRDDHDTHDDPAPQKLIDYGKPPGQQAPDQPDQEEHRWVGPESNPAAAGDDDTDAGWMGPESNPASGGSD